tara:strand:- start:1124 stop:3403 length:2280 start_codon:yes stop_codon:yes gene_type:complete
MAIKRYFADSDTTITNAFRSSLSKRGTDANMGASDILEVFSIYGQASSGSTELERCLIKFPISEIINDRARDLVPPSGSVNFFLKMYNAAHNETIPRHMTLDIYAVSRSWQEGIGLDMEQYTDIVYPGNIGATWMSASSTEAWTLMGGDYHTEPTYSAYFDRGYENLKIDVTPLIEEWISGTKENYGFGIHLTASQEAYFAEYSPREAVYFDKLAFLSGSGNAVSSSSGKDTLSAWVYPSEAAGMYIGNWVRTSTSNLTSAKSIRMIANQTVAFNQAYGGLGSVNLTVTTVATMPLDTWTHLAVSHDYSDPSGLSTVLYMNGISQSCTVIPGTMGPTPWPQTDFMIGSARLTVTPSFLVNPWSGSIDDVSYYNKILTSTEILQIYNGGCPNDLTAITSTSASLQHWWINGDDPRDTINFVTSALGDVSIYDQVGTYNLYATGTGGMKIVDSLCAGGTDIFGRTHGGQLINLDGAQTSYYTKKFFGRGSEFYYKKPTLEACWNSSIKDDRGSFYSNSPLLTTAENYHSLFLYNIYAGNMRDIPSVGTGSIFINIFSASAGGTALNPTTITGSWVSTGIYSFTEEINGYALPGVSTLPFTLYDRWYDASLTTCFHTGTFDVIPYSATTYHPGSVKYVSTITNLQAGYTPEDSVRLRLFTRLKNWSPTIYTVANSIIETSIIQSASYEIYRVVDDLKVIEYGTGSIPCTMMSYDEKGNYFDLDMGLLKPGYSYGIKIAFYDETSWVEQPYVWKFRVDELNEY